MYVIRIDFHKVINWNIIYIQTINVDELNQVLVLVFCKRDDLQCIE